MNRGEHVLSKLSLALAACCLVFGLLLTPATSHAGCWSCQGTCPDTLTDKCGTVACPTRYIGCEAACFCTLNAAKSACHCRRP